MKMRNLMKLSSLFPRTINQFKRQLSTSYVSQEIVFRKTGDPTEVLEINEKTLDSSLKPDEVIIKILAAPVHPADINVISGVYGIQPSLPAVPGLECVARVLQVGSKVKTLKSGDRAMIIVRHWGTWRTHQICPENHLIKVPDNVPTLTAATLNGNPCTAFRMLSDFVQLKPGDTVIQNTANSAVGQAVIQIARDRGFKTINVVRNRPNIEELTKYLLGLGADCILTDEELRLPATRNVLEKFSPPLLALNGAGGKILSDMLRYVGEGGTVVTYGGMTRQPVTIPTSLLIFKDLSFKGFWYSRWMTSLKDETELVKLMESLFEIIRRNNFQPPKAELVPFMEFKRAVSLAMEPFSNKKQILVTENIES